MAEQNLDSLYREAQSALKAKDYDRAAGLLTQILVIDENYRDASRLLALCVKLKRRRWYTDARLWGALGVSLLMGLGFFIAPKISSFYAAQAPAQVIQATTTPPATPPEILLSTPTTVPLTWKRISIGQEFARDRIIAFEIDPKDPDVLYVNMENAGFYQSIDGGISWRPVQLKGIEWDSIKSGLIGNRDRNVFSNTAPDGKKRWYQNGGLEKNTSSRWFVSEDGGATWRGFSEAGTHGSNAISFDPAGSVFVFCGHNICKFSPDAKQLTVLGKPEIGADSIIAISPKNPNTIYAGGEGLAVSRDGGITWTGLDNGLGSTNLLLEAGINEINFFYLVMGECARNRDRSTMEQSIYRSIDGGNTWEFLDKRGCFLIMDADGQNAYRLATDSDNFGPWIWRLSNNGRLWEKIRIPSAITTLTAHPSRSGVLFAYDDRGSNKYVTEDLGYTWKRDSPVAVKPCHGSVMYFVDTFRPMAIDPMDGNHVFFIDNGILLESHDSCETTGALATAPNTGMNSIAFDPNNSGTLFAGTDEGAYISYDDGKTWEQVNDGLLGATVVYSIVVDKDSNVYAATPYGIFKLVSK